MTVTIPSLKKKQGEVQMDKPFNPIYWAREFDRKYMGTVTLTCQTCLLPLSVDDNGITCMTCKGTSHTDTENGI